MGENLDSTTQEALAAQPSGKQSMDWEANPLRELYIKLNIPEHSGYEPNNLTITGIMRDISARAQSPDKYDQWAASIDYQIFRNHCDEEATQH
ncbi:hypothetical protein ACFLZ6_01175 [Nanoarchaeota archaeon]